MLEWLAAAMPAALTLRGSCGREPGLRGGSTGPVGSFSPEGYAVVLYPYLRSTVFRGTEGYEDFTFPIIGERIFQGVG